MNDQQDHHDQLLADPVTFAPPMSTAYLLHSTIWRQSLDPIMVFTSRVEAEIALKICNQIFGSNLGYCIAPFNHYSSLEENVTIKADFSEYGRPYKNIQIAIFGHTVPVYQSDLPY